jgi:hypothetical protein
MSLYYLIVCDKIKIPAAFSPRLFEISITIFHDKILYYRPLYLNNGHYLSIIGSRSAGKFMKIKPSIGGLRERKRGGDVNVDVGDYPSHDVVDIFTAGLPSG